MSLGAYDEDEHERREEKTRLDAEFPEGRSEYRGELSYDAGESTEALLDQFREIQGE